MQVIMRSEGKITHKNYQIRSARTFVGRILFLLCMFGGSFVIILLDIHRAQRVKKEEEGKGEKMKSFQK